MRELGRLVAEALDYIGDFIKPGITTNEIDKLVYDYHVNVQGGYPGTATLWQSALPQIVLHICQSCDLPRHSR